MIHQETNIFVLSKQDTNVMKGIAIIAMLCHHVYTRLPNWVEPYSTYLTTLGELGKVCVAIFLFCSGYGLAVQYDKVLTLADSFKDQINATIAFIFKRLIKFYLAYWLVFLIFVPITIFCFSRPLSSAYGENVNMLKRLCLDILGIQGLNSYNITWWFNKLIIMLYLAFPILFMFIKKTKWYGIIICFVLMLFSNTLRSNYYQIMLWQFPFILGIGWAMSQSLLSNLSKYMYNSSWINIGIIIILVFCMLQKQFDLIPFKNIVGAKWDGLLTIFILLLVITMLRKFSTIYLLLSFIGKHSINIYLVHTFLNLYWEPTHLFLHTTSLCRFVGINMWILLITCLLISIMIEYLKDKIYLNKLAEKILINIK